MYSKYTYKNTWATLHNCALEVTRTVTKGMVQIKVLDIPLLFLEV